MTSPVKPWEKPGVNNQQTTAPPTNASSGVGDLAATGVVDPGGGGGGNYQQTANPAAPPPIPARSTGYNGAVGGYSGYNTYGGGYGGIGGIGGYGYGSPYGTGMYGGYGGLGAYNRYGMTGYDAAGTNSFVRMAEENSRQAFQSIEGIVQAFGSVAMMLESTYSAVYNSFRAVIGVADHFSRMRTQLAQIFSALAVVRTLRWLLRKLLVLLRLREGGLQEDAWATATSDALAAAGEKGGAGSVPSRANWPLLLFFAVIIGGPYLIWKFLSSIAGNSGSGWASGDDDHFVAEALYDFNAQNQDDLSVRQGQRIHLAPKELQTQVRGWVLASVDGSKMGLVPSNYIRVIGRRRGRTHAQSEQGAPSQSRPASAAGSREASAQDSSQQQCDMDSAWEAQN